MASGQILGFIILETQIYRINRKYIICSEDLTTLLTEIFWFWFLCFQGDVLVFNEIALME